MSRFWKNKNVLVTGGTGFVGSFVTEKLVELGANVTVTSTSGNTKNISKVSKSVKKLTLNLLDYDNALKATKKQDIVMHLAAKVAGIQFNIDHPASMFGDNVIMTKNILDAAVKNKIERILITSSACVYPRDCTIPTPENEGFVDDPEPTNLGYGWSKRVSELMSRFYASEYGLKIALARPYNTYGPRDNFDPQTSHVIPAIIKRLYEGENPLVIWGSGKQTRSFIYVEELARGLIEATEKYAVCDPINIGSNDEVTIAKLTKLIVSISGTKTPITFDTTKPDGQPRRKCDVRKAKKKIGFEANFDLAEGLTRTIEWYKQLL